MTTYYNTAYFKRLPSPDRFSSMTVSWHLIRARVLEAARKKKRLGATGIFICSKEFLESSLAFVTFGKIWRSRISGSRKLNASRGNPAVRPPQKETSQQSHPETD